MAKRQRPPEAVQKIIAQRFHSKEDPKKIAGDYSIAISTVKDYAKRFPRNPRKVKRRVIPKQPTENTRVSNAELQGLRDEVQRLRGLLLDEILRNRGS